MILGILYATCFFICYLPQIYKVARSKNVEGLSLSMYVLTIVGYMFLALNMVFEIKQFNIGLTANCVIGTLSCLTIIYYIIRYKKR